MIELFDNWVILVDDYNYCLAKYKGTRTKEDKDEPVYHRVGWYSSLDSALRHLGERIAREKLERSCQSLYEAVQTIKESNARVEELLQEVCALCREG